MKKVTLLLLFGFTVLSATIVIAQTGTAIRGLVQDEFGDPIPGALININGVDIGAVSDIFAVSDTAGYYMFQIPALYTNGQTVRLYCSCSGWKREVVYIILENRIINKDFTMESDPLNLDDPVNTGVIGKTMKKKLSFTVDKVYKDQLDLVPASNMATALLGKVPAVKVRPSSGSPGTNSYIRMRGAGSIQSGEPGTRTGAIDDNEPMIIVDGVILKVGLEDIDALDIESIEMVKGAAGASMYGARGANGVIRIATKRGKNLAMNSTRVTFRNEYGFSSLPSYDNPLSMHHEFRTTGKGSFRQWADASGNPLGYEGDFRETSDAILNADVIWKYYWSLRRGKPRGGFQRGIDWFNPTDSTGTNSIVFQDNEYFTKLYNPIDEFFDPGTFYFNSLSIAQNLGRTNWRLSFANHRNSGIISDIEGYNRRNARFNLDHQLREGLYLDISTYYMYSKKRQHATGLFGLMFMAPDADLNEPNYDGTPYHINADRGSQEDNPVYGIHNQEDFDERQRIMGGFGLRYNPYSWFYLEGNFGFDRSDRYETDYTPVGYKTYDNPDPGSDGYYNKQHWLDTAINLGFTGNIIHSFKTMNTRWRFGYQNENTRYDRFRAYGSTLTVRDVRDLDNIGGTCSATSTSEKVVSNGFFVIHNLDYNDKYIADFLFRREASSLFGRHEEWNDFFRASAAWRLTEERWFDFGDNLNEFKIHYAIGTAGIRPAFWTKYEYYSIFAKSASSGPGNLGNKRLKPEFATEQEYGLEASIFDRIGIELKYAKTEIEDQVMRIYLPGGFGWGTQYQNAGTMENNTWEGSINYQVYSSRDFSWNSRFYADRTRQRITKSGSRPYRTGYENAFIIQEGIDYGTMYGVQWARNIGELSDLAQVNSDKFQVNDLGHIVYVGDHNWTDGISEELWGTDGEITDGTTTEKYGWGMPIKKIDEDGNSNFCLGRATPDFSWAFSNNLRWKGVQFYILFDAAIGGMVYNETRQWAQRENRHNVSDVYGLPDSHKKPTQYWIKLYDTNSTGSFFAEETTYVKLREISMRYTFNRDQLTGAFGSTFSGWLNRISIGVIGRNLLTWTDYTGFDPEVAGGTVFAVDDFQYPNNRQITAFIEIEF